MEVCGYVLPRRLQVAKHRNSCTDCFEVIERQRDVGTVGNRQQVENGIRGSSDGIHNRDRVLERLAGENLARQDLIAKCVGQNPCRPRCTFCLLLVFCGHRRRIHEAHSHRFDGGRHRIGGVHSSARTGPRAGVTFDLVQFLRTDFFRAELTDRLKGADDREVLVVVTTRFDRSTIDKDRGNVQTRDGNHRSGHVLIAPTDREESVHTLCVADGLYGICNDFAGDERILHPFGPHGDAIAYGDGAKHLRHRSRFAQRRHRPLREAVQAHITGRQIAVAICHADDWFLEVVIAKADGAQHCAVWSSFNSACDRPTTKIVGHSEYQ